MKRPPGAFNDSEARFQQKTPRAPSLALSPSRLASGLDFPQDMRRADQDPHTRICRCLLCSFSAFGLCALPGCRIFGTLDSYGIEASAMTFFLWKRP